MFPTLTTRVSCWGRTPSRAFSRSPFQGETDMSGSTAEFLNVRQTADELGVHENTVRNLERRGQLKAIRLPGSGFRRFLKEDVDRMRREMWSQFAPDQEMPTERRTPTKRHT